MRNDQIFVLLLVILLPMSGCFDGAVGDAEGTDDATEGGSDAGDSTTSESSQSRTWYSSGGVYQTYWDDGQYRGYYTNEGVYIGTSLADISNNSSDFDDDDYFYRSISSSSQRCLDWGPYYNSSTGDLLGERCNEWGYPSSESGWDLTDCTDNGGEINWWNGYRTAPYCRISFATINSSVGEALLIYEINSVTITTTCNGVVASSITSVSSYNAGKEYKIVPGSALSCVHEITYTQDYDRLSYYDPNDMDIWSVVYAIQDTVVV